MYFSEQSAFVNHFILISLTSLSVFHFTQFQTMDPFVNFRTEFPTLQHCLASQTSTCELEVRGVFDGLGKVDFCSENVTGKHFFYYRPQRSCGKVMFLHLSVILFGGGGVWQTHPPRRLPLQRTVRFLLECVFV